MHIPPARPKDSHTHPHKPGPTKDFLLLTEVLCSKTGFRASEPGVVQVVEMVKKVELSQVYCVIPSVFNYKMWQQMTKLKISFKISNLFKMSHFRECLFLLLPSLFILIITKKQRSNITQQ